MQHAPAACWRIQASISVVFHQRFLTIAAWHMQDIEWRRVGQGCIRRQPQSPHIAHRSGGFAVDAIGRVWKAGQYLEGPCQIDLIQSFEQERTDFQVNIVRNHGRLLVRFRDRQREIYRGIFWR
jgi:hypothetical protein